MSQLSEDDWRMLRVRAKRDPWVLAQAVLPDDRGVERFHRPTLDLMTRRGAQFVAKMDDPRYASEIMASAKRWCRDHDIDLGTPSGRDHLIWIITESGVNLRMSRSFAKTTYAEVALAFEIINDTDIEAGVASKSAPAADKLMLAFGNLVRGEGFQFLFPEIFPQNTWKTAITLERINAEARTRFLGSTVEGRSILEQWTGGHYGRIWGDDVVGTESGEASMTDALRWIAALRGISKSDVLGGTWRLFTGTVYDEGDDHTGAHINDPTLLSIVVPIWTKDIYGLDYLMQDGVPTLPEWYTLAAIRAMRAQTLANPEEGPSSWLNNFEMTTIAAGQKKIPESLINRQTLVIEYDANGGEILVRPDREGKPIRVATKALDKACGLDQAISERAAADEWVFGLVGQDRAGHRYLLDGEAGRGYEKMLASLLPTWSGWGCPYDIGMDTTGSQILTTDLMKRDMAYARFMGGLQAISAGNTPKVVRIIQYLVSGLRAGTLWIHPRLLAFRKQARLWNPESSRAKNPGTDDWLDAFSLALQVLRSIPVDDEALERSEYQAYIGREAAKNESLAEEVGGGFDYFDILGLKDLD